MHVMIVITLKGLIFDALGEMTKQSLNQMGYGVPHTRTGKVIEFECDEGMSLAAIEEMCQRFLINPIIEEYRIVMQPDLTAPTNG